MTEQMLRDADPYRNPGDLGPAAQELLEQIVAEPAGRRKPFGLMAAGVAAAVVVAGVTVPFLWREPAERPSAPAPASPQASATPAPLIAPAKIRQAAERGPRLVIGEPGWKVVHLEPYGAGQGEMQYEKGELTLALNWHSAKDYDSYRKDRYGNKEKVTVAGITGYLVPFGPDDFDVVTVPSGGFVVEIRAQPDWKRADLRRLVGSMRQVDASTWVSSISADVARMTTFPGRADRKLAGMPLPPGWDAARADTITAVSILGFDSRLLTVVGCGWLTEWRRATTAGDEAAVATAVDALRRARDWKLLKERGERYWLTVMAGDVVDGKASASMVAALQKEEMC
jgi:hypothetical protein